MENVMRDAQPSRPVGRAQSCRSRDTGFVLIVAIGLAFVSAGCTQPDSGFLSTPVQDHVQLPSLAPVVQAVIPAVVHVSAIQRPNETSVGEGTRPACGAR